MALQQPIKLVKPNKYHRHPLRIRMTPRKPFGSGPVVKKTPFGRCRSGNANSTRYT